MNDIIVAPKTRDLGAIRDPLAGWLRPHVEADAKVEIFNLEYPRGAGQSHETILFDAAWVKRGKHHTQGYVLRIKPTRHTIYPDDLFEEQYRVMQVLHNDGRVRIARPIGLERDRSLLGAPFFVMEKKVGRVPVSVPPYSKIGWVAEASPAERRCLWQNAVQQLAKIQCVPPSSLEFLRGKTGGAIEGLAQEWDKYVRFVGWLEHDRPWPVLRAALRRLESNWPKNQPAGLVWGDARIGNMMFDEKFDVVAVMDWEQPSLGGALHDLAWWLVNSEAMHSGKDPERPHLNGMGTREETISLWHEITGISTDDIEWYEEFTALKYSCTGIRLATLKGTPLITEEWLARRHRVGL